MAVRQSLRLHGLRPELSTYQDHCFIYLLDLDVGSILRCQPMSCCGKLLHKRCFRKAMANSFQCGHCRQIIQEDSNDSTDTLQTNETMDDVSDSPIWQPPEDIKAPTLIERARTAIADLRAGASAHSHHHPGSALWPYLPYAIDVISWYIIWVNLDWFLSTNPHAVVYVPTHPTPRIRRIVYQLIQRLFPEPAGQCLAFWRFRIRFRNIQLIDDLFLNPNEVTITNIRFTRFWSPAMYNQDYPYTTEIPNRDSPER